MIKTNKQNLQKKLKTLLKDTYQMLQRVLQ